MQGRKTTDQPATLTRFTSKSFIICSPESRTKVSAAEGFRLSAVQGCQRLPQHASCHAGAIEPSSHRAMEPRNHGTMEPPSCSLRKSPAADAGPSGGGVSNGSASASIGSTSATARSRLQLGPVVLWWTRRSQRGDMWRETRSRLEGPSMVPGAAEGWKSSPAITLRIMQIRISG